MSKFDPFDAKLATDAELTPEARQIMARARRSFGVSIAVLLVGFIAIGGALVYRASRDDGGPVARYKLEAVTLPAGAEVVSVSTGEGLVTVTYRLAGKTEVMIADGVSGAAAKSFEVRTK